MPTRVARETAQPTQVRPPAVAQPTRATPLATPVARLLDLQRQAGNRATLDHVQRFLAGSLANARYPDVHRQLTELYTGVPPLWKVQQVMTNPTEPYSSIEEIATALRLKPKAGTGAPESTPTIEPTPSLEPTKPTGTVKPTGTTKPTGPTTPTESRPGPPSRVGTPPSKTPSKAPGGPTEKPIGTTTPVTNPLDTMAPKETTPPLKEPPKEPKEGTLVVLDTLGIQEPETGQKVLATPPDFIRVRMEGAEYRVLAGQDFLNTATSARYKQDPGEIKGAKAQLQRPTLPKSGDAPPDDVRVIGDGHHRFIWGAFHGLPVAAATKNFRFTGQPWSGLTYKDAPGGQPTSTTPTPKTPPKKAVKAPTSQTEAPTENTAEKQSWPTMARIENPVWTEVEPLLASYGITEDAEKLTIKSTLEEQLKNSDKPVRGVTDLIGRALGADRQTAAALFVRQKNTELAPALTTKQMTVGRGDKRYPWEVKVTAGLFGWDTGIVSVAHARQIITKIRSLSVPQQRKWIAGWKWPTPSPEERNPWIATGVGKEGGQKGGSGEYYANLPLESEPSGPSPMMVLTDTGDLSTATVIAVNLRMVGQTKGDEVIVLTGIPWKYITGWWGKIPGQNNEQPKLWDKDVAATLSNGLKA